MSSVDQEKIKDFCEELGVPEPLEFLAQLMAGRDPRTVSRAFKKLLEIEEEIGSEPPDQFDWEELVELIKEDHRHQGVSIKESFDAAKQLADFTHAKKRSIDATAGETSSGRITPLTSREIRRFRKYFNGNY